MRSEAQVDAKYKAPVSPSPADIYQIFTYARLKDCQKAFLVYPSELAQPFESRLADGVRVDSFWFPLVDAVGFPKPKASSSLILNLNLNPKKEQRLA